LRSTGRPGTARWRRKGPFGRAIDRRIWFSTQHISIEELPVKFPRIPYRNQAEREKILNLVLADIIDAAGGPRESLYLKLLG
jgi:hypothetical protein